MKVEEHPRDQHTAIPQTRLLRLRAPAHPETSWLSETLDIAAQTGFNGIILDTFYHGRTIYPSAAAEAHRLPRPERSLRSCDLLAEACATTSELGLALYAGLDVLLEGWRHGFSTGRVAFRRRDWLAEARIALHVNKGAALAEPVYFCPANSAFREFIGLLAAEIADRYPLDGLVLDHCAIPNPDSANAGALCVCRSCCRQTQRELGFDIAASNSSISSEQHALWELWWVEKSIALAESIKARARECRTSMRIISLRGDEEASNVESIFDVVCVPATTKLEDRSQNRPLAFVTGTPQEFLEQVPQADGIVCEADTGLEPEHASAISHNFNAPAFPVELHPLRAASWHLGRAISSGPAETALIHFHSEIEALAEDENAAEFATLERLAEEMEDWVEANPADICARSITMASRLIKLALLWQNSGEMQFARSGEPGPLHDN